MPKIVAGKIDWLKVGHKLFAEHGISGIVVEKMAAKLKCNKSSFYWHFKTKKKFMEDLVDMWVSTDTDEIIARVNKQNSPVERFRALISITFKKDLELDFIFYLKRYGKKEKKVQELIDDLDRLRIEFVCSLLQDMGFSADDSKVKAEIFYKYLIGYHELIRYKTQEENYVEEVLEELGHFMWT